MRGSTQDASPEAPAWFANSNFRHITRHPEPAAWSDTWSVEAFTEEEKLRGTAIHEAAHAVLLAVAGVPVQSALIRTRTEVDAGGLPAGEVVRGPYSVPLNDLLVGLAAGERAEDRWLHEAGLWTVGRAWAVERHALQDRRDMGQAIYDTTKLWMTYGRAPGQWNDIAPIHRTTDGAVARHWPAIKRLTDALVGDRSLNGAQIEAVTGLAIRAN